MPNNSTAAERIAAQQRQMQGKNIQCDRCGSSYFKSIKIAKFNRGYGSVEVQSDPNGQEFELIECVCGFPVAPLVPVGRKAAGIYEGAHKEMRESIKFAQDHVKSYDPGPALKEIVNVSAGKHVEGKVDRLEERLLHLEETVLTGEHEAEDAGKAKGKPGRPAKVKEDVITE